MNSTERQSTCVLFFEHFVSFSSSCLHLWKVSQELSSVGNKSRWTTPPSLLAFLLPVAFEMYTTHITALYPENILCGIGTCVTGTGLVEDWVSKAQLPQSKTQFSLWKGSLSCVVWRNIDQVILFISMSYLETVLMFSPYAVRLETDDSKPCTSYCSV